MELKYLNTFKTIVETGSFQKAAERLNYAQSTITLQMQTIEQELAVKLFNKIGRKMELTQAGKELLPYVDAVLDSVQQMKSYSSSKELSGTLRVAMPESLLTYQMQPVIKEFRERAPKVNLSLQIPNCYIIREQIRSGNIDLGIHYDVGGYGTTLTVERLHDYPLALVASPQLSENELDFITPKQNKSCALLVVDANSAYHKIFAEYLAQANIVMNGEIEIGSLEAIKRTVASNLGVAYLPRYTVEQELNDGMLQELLTPLTKEKLTTVYTHHKNKWLTPAMQLFIELMKNKYNEKH